MTPTSATISSPAITPFLAGGGATGELMRGLDWATTPLGPPECWPQALKTLVGVMLTSAQPMFVAWGPARTLIYNDGYAPMLADRHPAALGQPFFDVWPETRSALTPLFEQVFAGQPLHMDDITLFLDRPGHLREAHFAFSYTPVRDEGGMVAGLFCPCVETTGQVFAERRNTALLALDEQLRALRDPDDMARASAEILGRTLGACRVGYGDFDADARTVSVGSTWSLPGLPDVAGVHRFADYGSFVEELLRGETAIIADVAADPRTADKTAAFRALGIAAHIDVPVMENGRVVALVFAHADAARRWTPDDAALAREVALRTRAAIARRRAEAALRESEARLRAVQDASVDGFMLLDSVRDGNGLVQDFRWAHANAAAERIIGKPPGWFMGRLMLAEMPGNREAGLFDAYVQVVETGEPWTGEFSYARDGVDVYLRAVAAKAGDGFAISFADLSERRRVEEQLRTSEERYRTLFESIDEGFCVIEFVDGPRGPLTDYVHVEANLAYERHAGISGIVGRTGRAVLTETEADAWVAIFRRVLETGTSERFERRFEGGGRDLEVACSRVEPAAKRQVAVVFQDISARKRVETLLRESEQRFRNMADYAPVMMWVTDPNGSCTYLNRAWYEFTGQRAEEALGLGWLEATHSDDKAEAERIFLEANAARRPFRIEYRLRRGDGAYRWAIDAAAPRFGPDGEFLGFVGSVVDIDERREIEEQLRTSEERYRTLFEKIDAGFCIVEVRRDAAGIPVDHFIVEVNPAFARHTGVAEAGGRLASEVAPGIEQLWHDTYGHVADTGETVRFEERVGPLGRWYDVQAFPASAPGQQRVAVLFNDISDRRLAEEALRGMNDTLEHRVAERTAELEAAHEQLRQSQKLEAMGQLTGGVAHDFNNLLTPIIGGLDMLQRKGLGGEREQRLIAGAMQSAERAKTLVQRLLAFARRQPLQPAAVDIGAVVRGMAELVESTTGPQIRVRVEAPPDLPPAIADANQVEMAILNLCVNARDAMPDGGSLTIAAVAKDVSAGNKAKLAPGPYVRLSVADTGVGMDEDTAKRAIEPFFSTKGIGKGTGLGLSMAHGLAAQLGGALGIRSAPGLGTRVDLWLPVAQAAPPAGTEDRAIAKEQPSATGVALLVDDEAPARLSTADMLADMGYRVVEADCAEAALRLIADGLRPDLVVTDHLMPGMTGTELASGVRAALPGVPVLLISGYADAEGLAPDMPRLTKPFRSAELAAAIIGAGAGSDGRRGTLRD